MCHWFGDITLSSKVSVKMIYKAFGCCSKSRNLVTIRKRSYGKVVFSQVCLKNSVHGGRGGVHTPWQTDTPLAGRHPPLAGRHPPTAADGTHPTGMHSCFDLCFNCQICKTINSHVLPFPVTKCPWWAQESWQPSRARDIGQVPTQRSPYHQYLLISQVLHYCMNK